jgi:hypothetical protein
MTPANIAGEVRRRGRYHRQDETAVPSSQIAARARQYPQIFDSRSKKSALQIRLKPGR